MIALLTGRIAAKSPDHLVLDVNGVGYRVHIPFSTYYDLPEEGSAATLHVYTAVREDAILLYGFRTLREKEIFQLLIAVSGVGPKLAVGILSNIEPDQLLDALRRGDLARLSSIPGIGKKTAERLVVELRDKAARFAPGTAESAAPAAAPPPGIADDVASALVNLGYKEAVVQKALAGLEIVPGEGVEAVLRKALKVLMK